MSTVSSDPDARATSTGHDLSSADWLDVHFKTMQPEYEEMLRWVGFRRDWHVLDAGCGSGSYLQMLTELVSDGGMVSAIDLAPENIRTVERRVEQIELAAPIMARVGSIADLPYGDDSFDAIWCANTTQYLEDSELRAMFAEFHRVTRPGGVVAIKEFDVTGFQVQPTTPTLMIHFIETACRKGNEYACNQLRTLTLPKWLREAGLIALRQKPTLMVRFQPLDSFTKQYVTQFCQYFPQMAQQLDLPEDEAQIWKELADTDSSEHILHHPDFQFRELQTVFVGNVPEGGISARPVVC